MNIETLRVFCDVVRSQSFSQGASLNGITQSAASQAVNQLERYFGVKLIDRSKRPFILTNEGQTCYEGFRNVLDNFDVAESRVRSMRQEISGLVRVAAIYSVGLHDMGRAMQNFMRQYPKARVRLEYVRPTMIYEAVQNEEVDLGIVSYPTTIRGINIIPLRKENMVLVCHPEHYLAKAKKVNAPQLNNQSFIGFNKDLQIRKELDNYFRQYQIKIKMMMEFDNIETIKQAVEIGAGISILPEPTVRKEIEHGTLVCVTLSMRKLRRPIGIIHLQRRIFTSAMAKFIELLRADSKQSDQE
ncbi:MAG: LysR family transcriptional regulator [Planctomycetota bacterium]|jgi:DNA-binding transcriptional LysR family regulator